MKKRLVVLANHRRFLLEKIEAQRMEVAGISRRWQKPLALVDTGLKAVRFMHNHPALVSGGVAALLAWRRKGIAGMAKEGWRLLKFYPSILSFGLNYLSLPNRSSSEKRDTEVDD